MKILIVDDSLVFRSLLKTALVGVPGIEVVGSYANGVKALEFLEQHSVDLVLLDLEMPGMDGLQVLERIRQISKRVKVVILAPPNKTSAFGALEALKKGADDIAEKPDSSSTEVRGASSQLRESLLPKIHQFNGPRQPPKTETKPAVRPRSDSGSPRANLQTLQPKVIVMACSTGGPKALDVIFSQLSGQLIAPILVVQHMPPVFTRCLAERLSSLTGIPGGEAAHGELLMTSRIYVAPGGYHLLLDQTGDSVRLQLNQEPPLNHVRPSADPLFESAARIFGNQVLGVILTGMGEDGSRGAQEIKQRGGAIVVQDFGSCVVDGMPRSAKNFGVVDAEMGLEDIARLIGRFCVSSSAKKTA